MPDSLTLDRLDRQLIHALRVDGRASFARLGAALGASEQTVARRYRRLRESGVIRVVAVAQPAAVGDSWLVRIRLRPGAGERLATAIARRPDVSWVSIVAGGAEVLCACGASSDALLLERLPATNLVAGLDAHATLHVFAGEDAQEWTAAPDALGDEQIAALGARAQASEPAGEPARPQPEDAALIELLGSDGRATHAQLGAAAGITSARAGRRLSTLLETGAVRVDLEIAVAAIGFPVRAWLWMRVAPGELRAVGEALSRLPETAFAAAVTGASNLVATIACRDMAAVYRYVTDELAAFPAIREVEVSPVVRQVKHERSVARDGRLPRPG